jgi:1-acyl-sn-glycerol-3-phosphate acyltransferase
MRLPLGRLAPSFPYASPKWPRGVERPPVERNTGIDYDTAWARRYGTRLVRALVLDGLTGPGIRALASPRVSGLDRLEALKPPVIFVANHASHLDTPLLLTSLPGRFRHRTVVAAGADYFFDRRWKAALWAFSINAIPIERARPSPQSTRLAGGILAAGWNLIIYPEGGRTPHGWGQAHRAGAAYLAVRTGAGVVPVHVEGTRRVLKKGGRRLTPSTTHLTFGRPLRPEPGEDPRQLALRIERSIAVLADEQATDWWSARRRSAAGRTPPLTAPAAGAWRRAWALREGRRPSPTRRWP